ncbi:hypothetical protein OSTOST_20883 [Ostertagia ostertagi]
MGEEINHTKEVNGNVEDAVDFLHNSPDVNHPSLEKLAELTAVMSRFELDVVTASTPQRARSKSEPTPMGRFPKTVVVKSFENVNENTSDGYTTSDSAAVSEISSPPTATSERKEITATVTDSCYNGYMWSGELPPRNYSNPTFSSKIFVVGVPWDISETALIDAFSPYGACRVEWPSKEGRSYSNQRNRTKVTGYVYIVFETERSVKSTTRLFTRVWFRWRVVFVGALHGMITAHVLFSIMNELYGNVVFVGIDTDKYRYPIGKTLVRVLLCWLPNCGSPVQGSGRVTFRSHSSYFHAIESAFLEIRTSKFCKKVQIDPFLEDSWCMVCNENPGPYFCRDRTCFRYYCTTCWQARHAGKGKEATHQPLTRHAPRSAISRADDNASRADVVKSPPRCYLQSSGNVAVAPLGGMAAVAAVARGTVPRHQHHAYQYMQLAPAYPSAVYSPALMQQRCRIGSSVATAPVVTGQPVTTSPSFIHQRLY